MVKIWSDRRTFLAVLALVALFCLGMLRGVDVRVEIVACALGVAAANVFERVGQTKYATHSTVLKE